MCSTIIFLPHFHILKPISPHFKAIVKTNKIDFPRADMLYPTFVHFVLPFLFYFSHPAQQERVWNIVGILSPPQYYLPVFAGLRPPSGDKGSRGPESVDNSVGIP